jgi:hypothetical protein
MYIVMVRLIFSGDTPNASTSIGMAGTKMLVDIGLGERDQGRAYEQMDPMAASVMMNHLVCSENALYGLGAGGSVPSSDSSTSDTGLSWSPRGSPRCSVSPGAVVMARHGVLEE